MERFDLRVVGTERGSQNFIHGVNRTITGPGEFDVLAVDLQPQRRGGGGVVPTVGVDGHQQRLQGEVAAVRTHRSSHQQLKGSIGGLELVAEVLQLLDLVDDGLGQFLVQVPTPGGGGSEQRCPPHQFAEQLFGGVADQCWVDVLVCARQPCQSRRVESGLVGEGGGTDVGAPRFDRRVHDFGDLVSDRVEMVDTAPGEGAAAHLEDEVGYDRTQVGVAGPLPVPIHASLDLERTGFDRGQ